MVTEKQEAVLDCLPDTRENIAEELGVSRRAIRYRMKKLEEEHGYEFYMTNDDVWHETEDGDIEREDAEPWRVDSYKKAHMTKEINNSLTELEKEVKEALSNAKPVTSDYERTGSSTLVLPHSDSHIGAIIEERHGVNYYSADEAEKVVDEYFNRAISYGSDAEDVVLVMNGDHLDGEGIYPHQRHEQEDNLRDQLRKAGHVYIEQILKLSDEFEHVWVYCIPGNHGTISKRSTTNADMMLYDFVETALSYSDADNINIDKAGPGGFKNFNIRGWDYHARHGDDFLNHVGTSSGQNRVKDAFMSYGYDVLLRSHYHSIKYETIGDEIPIIMTGSPAPPSTFAESKGADGGCCGVFWKVTDDDPIVDFQPIRVNN